MHQRRHQYDRSYADRRYRPRFNKNKRYSKRVLNCLEDSSSMNQQGRIDSEKGGRSSLLHSVVSPIPDESISDLYQNDCTFVARSSQNFPSKSLAELACQALCRSIPNMESEIPPGMPQDVVDMILNSLRENFALNATTLRSLRNCEMSTLSLANCRGVTDEWLESLAPRRYGDIRRKFASFSTSDLPVGKCVPSNPNVVIDNMLSEDLRDVCLQNRNSNPNPNENFVLQKGFSSKLSKPSSLSAGAAKSVSFDKDVSSECQGEYIANSDKHSYDDIDSCIDGCDVSFHEKKKNHEDLSPSLDETEISYDSTNSRELNLSCPHCTLQEQNYLPTCSEEKNSSATFAAATNVNVLDLRGCQHITDQGLNHLGHLCEAEVALFDNCHSLTGPGLQILLKSRKLHTLSFAHCRRLTDDGLVNISQCLPALENLSLEGCRCLTDQSLLYISGLVGLQQLDLSQCDLVTDVGLQYLENLANLSAISLGWCREISDKGIDTLTMQLGRADQLRMIRLARLTKLTDVGVAYICRLLSLEKLDLSGCCSVTSSVVGATLEKLTKLENLDISYCPGILRSSWQGKINSLKTLELCYSCVKDGQLTQFSNLSSLQELNLDSCPVGDLAIGYLADYQVLPNLLSLDLADTNITDLGMSKIAKFTKLTRLSLFYCNISNESLLHVSKLSNLEVLNIDSRDVSDDGLRYLRKLTKLRALDVFSGRVTDTGCSHLSNISSLESLDLCGGGVSDLGCSFLASLEKLVHLNLSQNERITNRGAAALATLTQLKSLNLSHTRVSTSGFRFFSNSRNLQSLALFGCKGAQEDEESIIGTLRDSLPRLRCIRSGKESDSEGMIVVSDHSNSYDDEEYDFDEDEVIGGCQSIQNSDSDEGYMSEYYD